MKPSFALDFRDGAITLLHRTSRGWQQVGSTPIDAPDLGEALTYLRSTALGLSPRGLSTKLVIPNEQVLYTQVHAPGPEVAKRKRQIKAALEGLTPYKVDDLVYDWWGNGPEIQVAVVARETLAEAEAFANEHRFNPVSFVAAPDSAGFMAEPFFGPSALAATLLTEGEKVERDQDPIAIIAREYPKAEAAPEPAMPGPVAEPPVPVAPQPVLAPEVVAEAVPEPELPAAEPEPPVPESQPEVPAVAVAPEVPEANPLPDFRSAKVPAAGVNSFDPKAMAIDLVDEAPMAVDVTDERNEPPVVIDRLDVAASAAPASKSGSPADQPPDDVPPSPAQSIIASFASRRQAAVEANPPAIAVAESVSRQDAKTTGDADLTEFASAAAAKAKKMPVVGPAPAQRPTVPRPTLARPASPLPSAQRDTVPFPVKSAAARLAPGKSVKPGVTAPGIAGPRRERNVVPLPKAGVLTGEEGLPLPASKPAVKGLTGLDGRPLPVRGKPRYLGLILTLLLLIALALVAAWSSFYLTSTEADPNAAPAIGAVASATPEDARSPDANTADAALAPEELPTPEDEALADGQDPDLIAVDPGTDPASDPATDPAAEAAAVAADPATIASTTSAPEATEPAAAVPEAAPLPEPAPSTAVATEAAIAATPSNEPQDEIFLASADTPPQTSDPLALPQMVSNSDPPPEATAPPPPFGTVYTFDADGRIQPTPEGIMTPEGVLLIAGPPKVIPPVRPAALVAAAPAVPTTEATTAAALPTAEPVVSDPALAGKKPRQRPAGLVDAAATAEKQGEVLAPDPNSRFASLRPHQRPAALTVQTAAVVEPEPTTDASAASLASNGVQASTSALAVVVSKRPAVRPSSKDQAVEAAVAAAVSAPEPQLEVAANVAPEAEPEPEVEVAAPRLPTNASVAKQATQKDALNLSRVALLGIFGTASGRYAMVRQPGGGVKKVVVGDTIDGGRIAAITATAVQYKKGGRMVTLSLPTG